MIDAILYTTNTGFTRQYAELLSLRTGVPAYNTRNVLPPKLAGKPVLYMGWTAAGVLKGYQKIAKKYNVRAVCQVGMTPYSEETEDKAKRDNGIDVPLFWLQGGLDAGRLHGAQRWLIRAIMKGMADNLQKKPDRTEEENVLLHMAQFGGSCVSADKLARVLEWYRTTQAE